MPLDLSSLAFYQEGGPSVPDLQIHLCFHSWAALPSPHSVTCSQLSGSLSFQEDSDGRLPFQIPLVLVHFITVFL